MTAIARSALACVTLLVVALGGCDAPGPAQQSAAEGPSATETAPGAEKAAATPSAAQGDEADSPPAANPIRAGSPEDAIRAYYAAIDAGQFARAYRLWGREGQASGQSYAAFRQGFAATRSSQVTVTGRVESEGAAGSIYATVPVEVDATLKDGTRQRFTGEYVLRRVNDVPGASDEQLNWHIESAALKPA